MFKSQHFCFSTYILSTYATFENRAWRLLGSPAQMSFCWILRKTVGDARSCSFLLPAILWCPYGILNSEAKFSSELFKKLLTFLSYMKFYRSVPWLNSFYKFWNLWWWLRSLWNANKHKSRMMVKAKLKCMGICLKANTKFSGELRICANL